MVSQKSQSTPSPLTGEGWGEGEKLRYFSQLYPLPLIPFRQGRGNRTFYEFISVDFWIS